MTKNIRKVAPEGAEYFRITGDCIEYAKLDCYDRILVYHNLSGRWRIGSGTATLSPSECGFHAFEAPKWIWFALGGLFGAVIVGLLL